MKNDCSVYLWPQTASKSLICIYRYIFPCLGSISIAPEFKISISMALNIFAFEIYEELLWDVYGLEWYSKHSHARLGVLTCSGSMSMHLIVYVAISMVPSLCVSHIYVFERYPKPSHGLTCDGSTPSLQMQCVRLRCLCHYKITGPMLHVTADPRRVLEPQRYSC